ncbi:SIMPL domain-containing protein [Leptothoe sp. EHU-05/26/07-4]|uniref:DUF541 domain-containing protein n=1 Tax=Adonisia turfae CCMR0081 TaxID=2292702 RepID=A0A6M0RST4_9CYAN|nr:SIMPL domain-containing protein [Adonisia turfae]NEZ59179.1 DUF541 domain-containing protein [Adonisia turfae CCMR0081]
MQRLAKIGQRLLPWLLTALILMTVGGLPALAQGASTPPRIITVTGHGHHTAPTTLAEITLGISDKGDSAKATYTQLAKRTSAIAKTLKARKVDNIKTSNVHLDLKYGRDGKPQKDEYEAYRNIEFQVPADEIGVLDNAIALNIDRIQNIRYLANEKDLLAARDQALEKAITDAQAQAKVALDQLGFSLEDVVDIQVNDAITQAPGVDAVPKGDGYASGSWSAASSLAVEDGAQAVDVQVTLKVQY